LTHLDTGRIDRSAVELSRLIQHIQVRINTVDLLHSPSVSRTPLLIGIIVANQMSRWPIHRSRPSVPGWETYELLRWSLW